MDIKDIKDLEKVIKLCRKNYVDIIKIGDIEIVLGRPEKPKEIKPRMGIQVPSDSIGTIDEDTQIPIEEIDIPGTDDLTEEQKLFGSSDPSVWETTNT